MQERFKFIKDSKKIKDINKYQKDFRNNVVLNVKEKMQKELENTELEWRNNHERKTSSN